MESKVCGFFNTKNLNDVFHNRYSEGKPCNIKRSLKRYYESKDMLSIQRKQYYQKIERDYYRNEMIHI